MGNKSKSLVLLQASCSAKWSKPWLWL